MKKIFQRLKKAIGGQDPHTRITALHQITIDPCSELSAERKRDPSNSVDPLCTELMVARDGMSAELMADLERKRLDRIDPLYRELMAELALNRSNSSIDPLYRELMAGLEQVIELMANLERSRFNSLLQPDADLDIPESVGVSLKVFWADRHHRIGQILQSVAHGVPEGRLREAMRLVLSRTAAFPLPPADCPSLPAAATPPPVAATPPPADCPSPPVAATSLLVAASPLLVAATRLPVATTPPLVAATPLTDCPSLYIALFDKIDEILKRLNELGRSGDVPASREGRQGLVTEAPVGAHSKCQDLDETLAAPTPPPVSLPEPAVGVTDGSPRVEQVKTSSDTTKPAELEVEAVTAKFVFAPDGDGYWIKGFGQSGHFTRKGAKGFDYIAQLIRNPGVPVVMGTLVGPGDTISKSPEDGLTERSGWGYQPAMDPDGRSLVEKKLQELLADREEARKDGNQLLLEEIENEIAEIERPFRAAFGKYGVAQDLNSDANKLRPSINRALNRACEKLEKAGMVELAKHFRITISARYETYVYEPTEPITWVYASPFK